MGSQWTLLGLQIARLERSGRSLDYNLTILPLKAFYPLDWIRIHRIFRKPERESESSGGNHTKGMFTHQ
ncbi:unnamed protein product [Prunus armeniaca]